MDLTEIGVETDQRIGARGLSEKRLRTDRQGEAEENRTQSFAIMVTES